MTPHAPADADSRSPATPEEARFIAVASSPVAAGFELLGAESFADATEEQLERLLEELVVGRQSALVFVEDNLARGGGRWLSHVRDYSDSIVLVEIPGLRGAQDHESAIEGLIRRALGQSSLEPER